MSSTPAPVVPGVCMTGHRTVFSLCGMCATHCPIQVEVEDGRVVWLQGNPNDKAMGASLCARGAAGLSLEYDDERPQYPMIRTGARGSGEWRRASWDEALDYVADGLKRIIAKHGAKAVALSDRGGHFTDLTKSFVQAIGSPNYVNHDTSCASNAHHAALSLFGRGRAGFAYDLKNTRHVVLYGRNIIESLQVKEAKDFMSAIGRGAKCTYIDPRVTFTACKATRYWQIKPNADYALNLAILHQVLAEQFYDKKFVARWVSGMDYLADAVREYTPEWQQAHTGIPAEEVRAFVREIAADAPRVIFHGGWMTARHSQSFYVSRTAYLLNALMGSIETPGGLIFAKEPEDIGRSALRKLSSGLPKVTEKRADGAGWRYPAIDTGTGLVHRMLAAMESGDPYQLGAYIVYRHDPLISVPDPEAVKRALDKLDLLVAVDVNYSETAWYSDVILPEATYLERANILASAPGPRPSLLMRDQAVAPRFDSRPAWWIFRELARRLGVSGFLDFETIEDLWAYQLQGTGVSVDELRSRGVLALTDRPVFADRENGLKFKTPSGKVEIASERLRKAGVESLPPYRPAAALAADEFRLLFGRTAVHTHGQTMNNPLLHELRSENPLWIHPERAAALGISDGDTVEISRGAVTARAKVQVTPMIHPEAAFLLHGFGRSVPKQSRANNNGVADQRLQTEMMDAFDSAGGGSAMTETTVRIHPSKAIAGSPETPERPTGAAPQMNSTVVAGGR